MACKNYLISESLRYVVGDPEFKDCEEQGMLNIRDSDECNDACEELEMDVVKLRDNMICFSVNNRCRQQNKSANKKSKRICKKEGSL